MQTNNTSQALILFDPKVNSSATNRTFDLDTEASRVLQTERHSTVSETEHLAEQHRQLRYLAEVERLTKLGVSVEAARTLSLGEIRKGVDRLAEILHRMEEETTTDASHLLVAHQTRLLTAAEANLNISSSEVKDRETKITGKKRKKQINEQRDEESKNEIAVYRRTGGRNEENSTGTKPAKEVLSNKFVNLDSKAYSFHNVAGAYLGQETRGLIKAAETAQTKDLFSQDENLTKMKIKELATAFLVTMPKEFLTSLLSIMNLQTAETRILKLRDELLSNRFRPLKESFMRLLDNNSKNLNWDSIIKIFKNEMKSKKWKDGIVKDTSATTKGISPDFIKRLELTWKNQGHLTSKPELLAI